MRDQQLAPPEHVRFAGVDFVIENHGGGAAPFISLSVFQPGIETAEPSGPYILRVPREALSDLEATHRRGLWFSIGVDPGLTPSHISVIQWNQMQQAVATDNPFFSDDERAANSDGLDQAYAAFGVQRQQLLYGRPVVETHLPDPWETIDEGQRVSPAMQGFNELMQQRREAYQRMFMHLMNGDWSADEIVPPVALSAEELDAMQRFINLDDLGPGSIAGLDGELP